MKINQKKGIPLGAAFSAVLIVLLLGVLVIVGIFLYNSLGSTFTANSAAANASNSMVTQFASYVVLVGLVGTIVFLGVVIGVLISSFAAGGKRI